MISAYICAWCEALLCFLAYWRSRIQAGCHHLLKKLTRFLSRLTYRCRPRIIWRVGPVEKRFTLPWEERIVVFTLKDNEKVSVAVEFVSASGNPAKVDGPPSWESSDPAVLTVTPAGDGMTCMVTTVGPVGTARVTCKADADLGAGMKEIILMGDFEVIAGEAVGGNLNVGTPEPR